MTTTFLKEEPKAKKTKRITKSKSTSKQLAKSKVIKKVRVIKVAGKGSAGKRTSKLLSKKDKAAKPSKLTVTELRKMLEEAEAAEQAK